MPTSLHDLHSQVNVKQGYVATKSVSDNSIAVFKNGAVMHNRVVYEGSTDRVFICNGGGVSVGSATAWLNSLK